MSPHLGKFLGKGVSACVDVVTADHRPIVKSPQQRNVFHLKHGADECHEFGFLEMCATVK